VIGRKCDVGTKRLFKGIAEDWSMMEFELNSTDLEHFLRLFVGNVACSDVGMTNQCC